MIAPAAPTQSVARAYLVAALSLLPTGAAWFFTPVYLLPKLKKLWHEAGAGGGISADARWPMELAIGVFEQGQWVAATVALALVAYEWAAWSRGDAWRRHRGTVLMIMVLAMNTVLLVGLMAFAIAALVAIPAMPR